MEDIKKSKLGEAMHRDLEQTKHDFNKNSGQELNQDVSDTVGQAAGNKPIPPASVPNYKPADRPGNGPDFGEEK